MNKFQFIHSLMQPSRTGVLKVKGCVMCIEFNVYVVYILSWGHTKRLCSWPNLVFLDKIKIVQKLINLVLMMNKCNINCLHIWVLHYHTTVQDRYNRALKRSVSRKDDSWESSLVIYKIIVDDWAPLDRHCFSVFLL